MKNYLNTEEQRKIMSMIILGIELDDMAKSWNERGNLTEDEHKALCDAYKGLDAALLSIFKRLPPEQHRRISYGVAHNTFSVRPKLAGALAKAKMEQEVRDDEEEGAFIPTKTVENIADVVLYNCCHPCKLDACDRETCKAREVLICLDIPMFDYNASGDKCPYDNGGE